MDPPLHWELKDSLVYREEVKRFKEIWETRKPCAVAQGLTGGMTREERFAATSGGYERLEFRGQFWESLKNLGS
jgi:hypothetical protein